MGPKKDKTKNKINSNKCPFFDRGYCKNRDECDKKHPDKVCDDNNCYGENCNDKRHPNPCKFGTRCKFNRKKECLFSHVTSSCDDDKINALEMKFKKEFDILKKQFKEMQNVLENKDAEIQLIQTNYNSLETDFKEMVKQNREIEERFAEITQHNETILNESIAALEISSKAADNPKFNCSKCNFTTVSERGLKVHMKRKHESLEDEQFPKVCDFCDRNCFDKKHMKEHLAEHSFRNLKFKCEDCDFLAEDNLSLEVHAGKAHSGNFECALCGFTGKDISDLDTHLHTCETFTCRYCLPAEETFSMISDVKTHLSNKHPKHIKHTDIEHIQMDRKNSERVSKKVFRGSYFF